MCYFNGPCYHLPLTAKMCLNICIMYLGVVGEWEDGDATGVYRQQRGSG